MKKVHEAKPCICGKEAKVCQWTDTLKPNATWMECKCGIISKTFYSKDSVDARNKCIKAWNNRASSRRIQKGVKSCGFCGSSNCMVNKFEHSIKNISYFVVCEDCHMGTDEMDENGILLTRSEAIKVWNAVKPRTKNNDK